MSRASEPRVGQDRRDEKIDARLQDLRRAVGGDVPVASVVTMVDAKGPKMDDAETVTLFNDL